MLQPIGPKAATPLDQQTRLDKPLNVSPPECAPGLTPDGITAGANVGKATKKVGFAQLSLADFFRPLKAGDRVGIDGPLSYNGSGVVKALDENRIALSFTIDGAGPGEITLTRVDDNRFRLVALLDGERHELYMRESLDGDELVFTSETNPDKQLTFCNDGGEINLDPDGFDVTGTFDITKR